MLRPDRAFSQIDVRLEIDDSSLQSVVSPSVRTYTLQPYVQTDRISFLADRRARDRQGSFEQKNKVWIEKIK